MSCWYLTIQVTKLSNGLLVASVENNASVSRVTVAAKAGARYEDGNQLGLTHFLRHLPVKHNYKFQEVIFLKGLQQLGSSFYCSNSREYMYYTVESLRTELDDALLFLEDVSVNPFINYWDIGALDSNLKFDLLCLENEPVARSLDSLHLAAYRNTLGRSLYMPDYMIGNFSSEQINEYTYKHYSPDNMAVIGIGVDHDELVSRAEEFDFSGSPPTSPDAPIQTGDRSKPTPPQKAVYKGGEIRIPTYTDQTVASVAVEGSSLCDKDLLAVQVLQNLISHHSSVKYGAETSKLNTAISKATNKPFHVRSFNMSYTDGGLFGFTACSRYDNIRNVLKAAFDQFVTLTKGGISEQEVSRAKTQLKADLFMSYENGGYVLDDLCEQVLCHEKITSPAEIAKKIDAVSVKEVEAVAKKIGSSKPSMSIIGNLSDAPYLDELYK
ncbi:hypothetical protein LOTGIDRAFT_156673 [Lottia gigantea]|uniref:Peptidase M16 N-terminal domain-containing protein n=1 Tax=Lottia gigantea TaxID=225164 RepID=V4B194_LOTGI|nr:hypothetical protein LOTGIDRAFT_156673 [Lottia gigantea]ESP04063.1 hypothetical protein LOTGIDRAFT_156673 [Lottia gigantea]